MKHNKPCLSSKYEQMCPKGIFNVCKSHCDFVITCVIKECDIFYYSIFSPKNMEVSDESDTM